MIPGRLLFVVNDASFFISHRLPIAIAAREQGFDVHVATPNSTASKNITKAGFIYHSIPLSRSGKNPFKELKTIWELYFLMRAVQPQIVHLVTIKPVLYGGIVARMLKIPAVVAAVSGLGYLFTNKSFSSAILRRGISKMYRLALKHRQLMIIFQNPDDRQTILEMKACSDFQTILIRGSGVDTLAYAYEPEPQEKMVVVMIARLLKDKGVIEYVNAARQLKAFGINAEFLLIGDSDKNNPAFIDKKLLRKWNREGAVRLLGYRKDIPDLIRAANLVVLPSYREGFPKILMEAAACGRAVITTDVPGCRDAIQPGQTGLLVPVQDEKSLAIAIQKLIEDVEYRKKLGQAGRKLAEQEFRIEDIVRAHLQIYQNLSEGLSS